MFHLLAAYVFDFFGSGSGSFQLSAILLLTYSVWRVWRFTLLPKYRNHNPKMYPYWVPVFGHLVSFFRNTNGTITRARLYFANTREPFALLLGGQTLYVLTSARDVTEAYRNTSQLSFDEYVRGMLSTFIKDQDAVARMWASPPKIVQDTERPRHPNPSELSIAHLGEAILVRQLNPGAHASATEAICLQQIQKRIQWDSMPGTVTANPKATGKILSLKHLCQDVLLQCASRAIFGDALMDSNPHLAQDFLKFDDDSWKLNYRVPAMLCPGMNTSLEAIRAAFTRYVDLPRESKQDACWMVPVIENEMHSIGFASYDKASFFASLFWPINSNSWKLTFWMLGYILHSPKLYHRIHAEISPHLAHSTSPTELVSKLQSGKWLMATYHETLRMTIASTSVRRVRETCVIGNKTLQQGSQVIIPYRQMLMDNQVFGNDASAFNPARFIENPALLRHASYRPFGGGVTYCPGRYIALKETLVVVSLLLGGFRLSLSDPDSPFPDMEENKPCLGVMPPVHNADVRILVERA